MADEAPVLQDINFFTTYACNSRCMNCCIWKGKDDPERAAGMDEGQLLRLFDDPLFRNCRSIGLAGGEPTISPFFWKLLPLLPEDKHITITTNALSSRRLIRFFETCRTPERYLVQVSVDGPAAVHDRIRGVGGSFDRAVKLLEALQTLHVDRLLSFTLNRLNYHHLTAGYELAQRLGARFSTRMAHSGGAYGNRENKSLFLLPPEELSSAETQLKRIIRHELGKADHSPAQLVFLDGICNYCRGEVAALPCMAMETGLVMDLYGEVFPNCPAMMRSIGCILEDTLSHIWAGERASRARALITARQCGGCWNDCQVVTNIGCRTEFLSAHYARLKSAWLKERAVPSAIDFGTRHSDYLLEGWHDLEVDGGFAYRWTHPRFSFFVPEGTRRLDLHAMIPGGGRADKRIRIEVINRDNRNELEITGSSGWQTYPVDFSEPLTTTTECRFQVTPYYCPEESGDGADGRKLGMAVHKIGFET